MTDFGGKTSIFSHPVYFFLRKFSLQDFRGGSVDPLKCILCGCQMSFTGLKRGYRLTELVLMHEPLAQQRVCG
ncbi:TPA: hypothetical protein HNN98_24100 [Escherichia coli]|nr:hypothetical protein [Escherichia coli]